MFAGPSHGDWEETADLEQHRVKMRRVAAANRLFVFNDLDAADEPQTEAKLESAGVTRLEYLPSGVMPRRGYQPSVRF